METRHVGWPSQYLGALAAIISLVGFVGYLYGQEEFPGLSRYAQMAVHTTVCFLLLSSGIFLARPDRGFMRVVTRSSLGGVLARWLLPPALVLPIVLGGLVLAGYRAEAYTLPFALALIAAGNVIAFTGLVWGAAFALDRVEARRLRAEEERMRFEAREQAARAEAAAQQRERSRAEAAEQEAQRAVRTREDVLAIVSHDLKNPLGSISLSTQLMRRLLPPGEEGERLRKHTHTIERSVERMDRLIRDLLDMASVQAGQLKLDLGRYEVEDLVRDGLVLLEPLAIEKRVELRTRLCREPCWVECDRDRFFQVLSNLVGNALKFTPEGGTVTVEVVPETGSGEGFLRFSVHDTGPGIPAEALPHLFEPFWQVEGTGKKGTGLGLTISRGIVMAHGGSLEVESEQGQGSTFSFTLPRASLEARAGPRAPRALSRRASILYRTVREAVPDWRPALRVEAKGEAHFGGDSHDGRALDERVPGFHARGVRPAGGRGGAEPLLAGDGGLGQRADEATGGPRDGDGRAAARCRCGATSSRARSCPRGRTRSSSARGRRCSAAVARCRWWRWCARRCPPATRGPRACRCCTSRRGCRRTPSGASSRRRRWWWT